MFRFSWSNAVRAGALIGVLGGLVPSQAAAEIYGWVDASGSVTYSNLPPPKSARVIDVIPEIPPPSPQALAAAEAAHQSEMRALNDKVQQIERELQQARSAPPSYPVDAPPSYGPPPSYGAAASYEQGCDAAYYDCNLWDGPAYYGIGVPFWGFRPHRDRDHDHDRDRDGFHHGSHRFPGGGAPHFAGGARPGGGAPHFAGGARPVGGAPHFAGGARPVGGGHMHGGASSGPMAHR